MSIADGGRGFVEAEVDDVLRLGDASQPLRVENQAFVCLFLHRFRGLMLEAYNRYFITLLRLQVALLQNASVRPKL